VAIDEARHQGPAGEIDHPGRGTLVGFLHVDTRTAGHDFPVLDCHRFGDGLRSTASD